MAFEGVTAPKWTTEPSVECPQSFRCGVSSSWVCLFPEVPTPVGRGAEGCLCAARDHPGAVRETRGAEMKTGKSPLALVFSPPAARSVTQFP